jgi:hypothetical protein
MQIPTWPGKGQKVQQNARVFALKSPLSLLIVNLVMARGAQQLDVVRVKG